MEKKEQENYINVVFFKTLVWKFRKMKEKKYIGLGKKWHSKNIIEVILSDPV